jgi:ribosomal protein S18 acetylase RimI-like enzyme
MAAIRMATIADVPTIVEHRRAMFSDMGYTDREQLAAMASAFEPWVTAKMQSGEYVAFLAIESDGPAAGLGIWLMDWPPHVVGKAQRRANILNVYTRPDSRRRGLARRLMETALDWCRVQELDTIILHASPDGVSLYQSLGFTPTNEMRLLLK